MHLRVAISTPAAKNDIQLTSHPYQGDRLHPGEGVGHDPCGAGLTWWTATPARGPVNR